VLFAIIHKESNLFFAKLYDKGCCTKKMKHKKFKAAWWLKNRHLQTLWPTLFRRKAKIHYSQERLELPDKDFLDINWFHTTTSGPIVLILHGLNGSMHSPYVIGLLKQLHRDNYRTAVMHFRGCSGEPNRLARSYHSGETTDLDYVVSTLKAREPTTPIFIIGFSLGGNVLLKWLGEKGEQAPIHAAVAVSVPFELDKSTTQLNQGLSRLYQWWLVRGLKQAYMNKVKMRALKLPALSALSWKEINTFRKFDENFTAPLHGFQNADEYYKKSSSRQYLSSITVPTLVIHAADDPFTSLDSLPEPSELPAAITYLLTERGGHVGFIEGIFPWKPIYWLEATISSYLKVISTIQS